MRDQISARRYALRLYSESRAENQLDREPMLASVAIRLLVPQGDQWIDLRRAPRRQQAGGQTGENDNC